VPPQETAVYSPSLCCIEMATDYTHAVVGLGFARLYATKPMPWAYWGLALVLPVIPDIDVFSSGAHGAWLAHRGFTHSLAFALFFSVVTASVAFHWFRASWWSLSVLFFLMIASHGLLDALTSGGEKIPFFWPLAGRYGNWDLIPVSDIALELPDPQYSRAIRGELLWLWLPMGLLVGAVMTCRRLKRCVLNEEARSRGANSRTNDG
jgi:inner membrane protein